MYNKTGNVQNPPASNLRTANQSREIVKGNSDSEKKKKRNKKIKNFIKYINK